jgi:hypothetical protein
MPHSGGVPGYEPVGEFGGGGINGGEPWGGIIGGEPDCGTGMRTAAHILAVLLLFGQDCIRLTDRFHPAR